MFYQGRAMNALTAIAIIAEHQGYNIWEYDHKGKGKNFHNLVKFFIDFTENNEIVFKYAKEMKAPGPAKDRLGFCSGLSVVLRQIACGPATNCLSSCLCNRPEANSSGTSAIGFLVQPSGGQLVPWSHLNPHHGNQSAGRPT